MDEKHDNKEQSPLLHRLYLRGNLRTSIALTFALSTLLLAALLSVLTGWVTRQQIQQNVSEQMLKTARQTVDKLDRGMFERYRDIQNAATLLSSRELSPPEKRELVEMLQRTFNDYSWIGLTDRGGTVLVSTGQILEGVDVSGRPWFMEGIERPFAGDVHAALLLESLIPTEDGEPLRLVDIAFPVTGIGGQIEGVLGAHLNWQWAREVHDSLLSPPDIEKQIELFILDAAGNILLGSGEFEESLAPAVHEQLQAETDGVIIVTWPGGQQYLSGIVQSSGYREYPGLGWYVLVRQPTAVAFAPARQLSGQILLLGTLLGAVFAALGWVLAGQIVTPIQTITAATRRIRPGETVATIPQLQSYDEITTLADTLRELLVELTHETAERQAAEEALRRSEARYRSLAESSGVGIWQITPEGQSLYINPAMHILLGLDHPDELTGKTYHQFFTPESLDTIRNHHAHRTSGVTSSYEVEIIRLDGQRRNVMVYGAPVLTAEGHLHSLIGTFVDITESQQALANLMAEKSFTESAIDSLPGIFYLFNTEGRFLRWNKNFEAVSGYSSAEMAQLHPLDLFVGEDKVLIEERIGAVFETGAATAEAELVAKDGRRTPYFFTGRRMLFRETVCLVGMGINITERKQAAEALQQSKTELQHIIDTVPEGVLLLTADGHIRLANPVAEQYLTVLAPEQTGGRLTHLGHWPLNDLLTSPPKGLWHEISLDEYVFEAIARPVENSPTNTGWVLVLRDITQEREIQQRVQRQERLAAVGQLAAGIAHDFNNILAVITLYTQLLSHTTELPGQAQEKLTTISQQAQRAADLIQQILDFSRQSVMERRPLDLLPFMKEQVRLLDRTLPEHIQIEFNHTAEEYITQADPSRIQQVIMNLAVNARDAMPQGGQLQITLAYVQTTEDKPLPVRGMPPGRWVQIQMADSGSGIPPEILAHIFEPFFTTKEVGKGTGLGLAQVYGIIQQHDGYIDVATTEGEGTTFILYFPALAVGGDTTAVPDSTSLQMGHGEIVLVVEDDLATRKALVDSLSLLNYEVIEAANGREALLILTTKIDEIALVLSDVVMPEMGGVALIHAIRQHKLTIPIILLTGHPLGKEMENLQALGLAGWLPKPPNLVHLSQLLAQALAV